MFNLTQQQKQSNLKTTYKNNMYGHKSKHTEIQSCIIGIFIKTTY